MLWLLQSLVSHDPPEIIIIRWFAAQEIGLLVSMLKTVVLLNIFLDTIFLETMFFTIIWGLKVQKNCIYFKYKHFVTL